MTESNLTKSIPYVFQRIVKEVSPVDGKYTLTEKARVFYNDYNFTYHSGTKSLYAYDSAGNNEQVLWEGNLAKEWYGNDDSVTLIVQSNGTMAVETPDDHIEFTLPEHISDYIKEPLAPKMTSSKVIKKHWLDLEIGDTIVHENRGYADWGLLEFVGRDTAQAKNLRHQSCVKTRTAASLKSSGYCDENYVFNVLVEETKTYPYTATLEELKVGDLIEVDPKGHKTVFQVLDKDNTSLPLHLSFRVGGVWFHKDTLPETFTVIDNQPLRTEGE